MELFESSSIVTNGTYGIPSVPGHLVTVSLDGPEALNDALRGGGVFQRVKRSVHARARGDGTTVILQMTVTRENAPGLEEFVEAVRDWPIDGVAFTFYVPTKNDDTGLAWHHLRERDPVVRRVIALKRRYPDLVKSNVDALERMLSDVALESTGTHGERCLMRRMLPLYMGEGGRFERTFCCYGNDVDCRRCGAYAVFRATRTPASAGSGSAGA
jgi:MoaA/NifB/PqqE/SkfB family radical SAM enzyme